MSHWRQMMVYGAEFWISCQWLAFLSKQFKSLTTGSKFSAIYQRVVSMWHPNMYLVVNKRLHEVHWIKLNFPHTQMCQCVNSLDKYCATSHRWIRTTTAICCSNCNRSSRTGHNWTTCWTSLSWMPSQWCRIINWVNRPSWIICHLIDRTLMNSLKNG